MTEIRNSDEAAGIKAATLIESLPWVRAFSGKIIVVKFGGNAMVSAELTAAFAEDMVYLHSVGITPVVVHGGGPQITAELERRNIPSEFTGGYRVTTTAAMQVVREVLAGQVSRDLVAQLNEHGPVAQAISGEDGGLFLAERRGVEIVLRLPWSSCDLHESDG